MTRRSCTWLIITAIVVTLALFRVPEVQIAVEGGRVEPAFVRFRVRVEPHADNRGLSVQLYEGEFLVSSSWEDLHGEHSAATRWVPRQGAYALGGGDYLVEAHVSRQGQANWYGATRFRVIGR